MMQTPVKLCLILMAVIFGVAACGSALTPNATRVDSTPPNRPITVKAASPPDTPAFTPTLANLPTAGQFRLNPQIAQRAASGKPLVIRVSYHDISNEFAPFIRRGVVHAVEDFGANVELIGPVGPDAQVQIAELERLLEVGVDGLAISPVNSADLTPIINRYLQQGIPVVTYNTDNPESQRLAFIGQDLEKSGYEAAQLLAKFLGGRGDVIITTLDPNAQWSISREAGAHRAFAQYPDIRVLQRVTTGTEPQDIYNSIERVMQANKTIKGILSIECCSTPVAGEYIKRNRLMGQVTVVGFDELPQTLQLIKAGAVAASISQDPERQSFEAVRMLIDFINGKVSKPENVNTGITIVNSSNADEFANK